MLLEMKVPSPGESISEVEIATWLVEDGDFIEMEIEGLGSIQNKVKFVD